MKAVRFILIKVPRKLLRIFRSECSKFYYRVIYSRPVIQFHEKPRKYLIAGGESPFTSADVYSKLYSEKIESKIREADMICNHTFNILGNGSVRVSPEGSGYRNIEWHSDFKSGYRWNPETFYSYTPYGHQEGVDIKVPWELSRFQHLNILGQAYLLTKDRKYAEEVRNQIADWISNNQFCFGVNWKCAMDVAIRAVNWLVAMEYFAEDDLFSDAFYKEFYASIYEHGKYIHSHLEYAGKWTTNHYLADIAGLFFISVYCPFFKESAEWQKFSFNELHREIKKQVYPDGCSFESSTSYHRLALEMFFYSELLGRRAGIEFSEDYKDKLKKMFEALMYCMKPNGMIPQIGDNDSGRFLQFSLRDVLDHSYLPGMAALHFKDDSFKLRQFKLDEDVVWLYDHKAVTAWDSLDFREDKLESHSFPDAGWYVIRNNNDYCLISCGPNGGDGWHSHNDKLSFELVVNGHDVIVDPGTYVYTSYPEERNKFRSTGYHNTVKFDGYEQNEIPEKVMFSLPDRVEINNASLKEDKSNIMFQGKICYSDISHRRTVTYDKIDRSWKIEDYLICPENTGAKLLFHLAPTVTTDGRYILLKDSGGKIASIEVEGLELQKGKYDYSPEYGVKKEAEVLTGHISLAGKENIVVTTIKSLS